MELQGFLFELGVAKDRQPERDKEAILQAPRASTTRREPGGTKRLRRASREISEPTRCRADTDKAQEVRRARANWRSVRAAGAARQAARVRRRLNPGQGGTDGSSGDLNDMFGGDIVSISVGGGGWVGTFLEAANQPAASREGARRPGAGRPYAAATSRMRLELSRRRPITARCAASHRARRARRAAWTCAIRGVTDGGATRVCASPTRASAAPAAPRLATLISHPSCAPPASSSARDATSYRVRSVARRACGARPT